MTETHCAAPPAELTEAEAARTRPPASLALDTSKYLPYLADCELTEAQQVELLQALWSIMKNFVDLSFGLDSVQQLLPALLISALANEQSDLEGKQAGTDLRPACSSQNGVRS